jgi:AAA family ATP:ADP antiporter
MHPNRTVSPKVACDPPFLDAVRPHAGQLEIAPDRRKLDIVGRPKDSPGILARMTLDNALAPQRVRLRFREHPVEFLLGAFGEVRPGEATTVLLLTLDVFLLLTAYYLLKVAREPLILLGSGAEVKSYASVGQSVLLVLVASFYGWLSARIGRIALISSVTLFFAANLGVFWVLGMRGVALGVPFFLWVGIFNTVTVAQFWSFAADTYTEEQGKRLFPIVGIGSSIGAVGGAVIAEPLVKMGSPFLLMLIASGILVSTIGITYLVHRRAIGRGSSSTTAPDAPLGSDNAFGLIVRDRYLMVFAILVFVLNIVTKTGDYVLDRMLVSDARGAAHALGVDPSVYIGEFKARYFEWINSLGVILQMLFVSRVIKYAGLRVALVLVPLSSLAGYGAALAAPLIGVLFVGRVAESTLDYSLSNTTRQALWLVTSRDAKYKAKQVIDTFVMRAGDSASAALVWVGTRAAMGARGFLAINVALSVAWAVMAVLLGREYARRSASPAISS